MWGYTYVPRIYEIQLAAQIEQYINDNPSEFTVVTPFYKEGVYETGNNLVKSKLITNEIIEFPNSIEYNEFGNETTTTKTIIGFTLKGDMEQELPPDVYNTLMTSEGVVFKDNSIEYLQFLNSL